MRKGNKRLGPLDRTRALKGTSNLKSVFADTVNNDREKALLLLNNNNLNFGTFFSLIPEIKYHNLYSELSQRNITALRLYAKILKDSDVLSKTGDLQQEYDEDLKNTLTWILGTGAADDGLSEQFDEVIDSTAAILIRTYKDKSIIKTVLNLIFKRYKTGRFVHDLVWGLFGARDAGVLRSIAHYLKSAEQKDFELASKLLNIDAENAETIKDRLEHYKKYNLWLNENAPFLNFTNESFNYSSNPLPCFVNLDAKYLCKKSNISFTEDEKIRLDEFHQLDNEGKRLLSKYSNRVRSKNVNKWKKWMDNSIGEQLKIAKKGLGGEL